MKYIFVWPYGWFDSYMYRDLFATGKVVPYRLKEPFHYRVLNFIRRVHCSNKVNNIVSLPFKDIWNYSLLQMLEDNTCIIFDTGALSMLSASFLYKIKNYRENIKMALFIVDSLHGSSEHLAKAIPNILNFPWDARLSYDINDCTEFGFDYLGPNIYSALRDVNPYNIESDIYYIGRNKANRNRLVLDIYDQCIQNGVQTDFNLIDKKKSIKNNHTEKRKGLHFSYIDIPYENVVSHVLSTNCILEVVANGQKAQTARYYESICYNKKLLTNNHNIKDLPFYNESYMKVFERVEDIDFEWIRRGENINYNYNDEFSPIHALDKLKNIIDT